MLEWNDKVQDQQETQERVVPQDPRHASISYAGDKTRDESFGEATNVEESSTSSG